ncbi:type I-E CRISPR-associated protein Cas5/CasD [Amycolatopsis granulosa]|uniref:type I-E CRISPR-associated protein Cas5/CasD n=1 Tax=Amycolatopsis granulosa TaxID=185684 RepID=UPI001423CC87|nr:type I-E CRISPR-associated protein Cas5/CasD [Amycolatopsis granulosa]NIH83760.1 CRISPR system Cascade subunit CasD [Amycolatopsis granulosa]
MSVLLLRLAAPLQSWGTSSRFTRRTTDRAPSKSGIIGLLAAAAGRRRTDSIEDLATLRFGVRLDQPGHVERDFHTARPIDGSAPLPLSYRFYLADAVFLAVVEGEEQFLTTLHEALRRPVFPLYLGRRSCPPSGPLTLGVRNQTLEDALAGTPWQASPRIQQKHRAATVTLDTAVDAPLGEQAQDVSYLVQDEPVTFAPEHRQHAWRTVIAGQVTLPNPDYMPTSAVGDHDPMALFGAS